MYIDTIQEEIEKFNDLLIPMRNVDGLLRNVDQYLGKIDAEKEWNDNPNEAQRMFLHTQSYSDFNKEDSLILLGRTGTGKTAIIRCLCENINQGQHSVFNLAAIAPFNEILYCVANTITDFSNVMVNYQISQVLSMYLNCYVMKALIKENPNSPDYTCMKNYIEENGLKNLGDTSYQSGHSVVERLLEHASKLPGSIGETMQVIHTTVDIINALSQNGYEDAYIEMQKALQKKQVLVLVDTLNEYDLQDPRIVICLKSLITTCFSYYNNSKNSHIHVKISIPSEIHTHLIEQLPGKQQGNTVVIQWKNNDLLNSK